MSVPSRLFSTTRVLSSSSPSAAQTASAFLTTHSSKTHTRTQHLDPNQTALLHQTLNRPPLTTPLLPAGYHLTYFTPSLLTSTLSSDGTDGTFNPPPPFTRRMWAGGSLTWSRSNPLHLSQPITESTTVQSAKPTRTAAGAEMVVVGVSKAFCNPSGISLVDRRNWLFLEPFPVASSTQTPAVPCEVISETPTPKPAIFASGGLDGVKGAPGEFSYWRDHFQTPASLFRFSALTFNGHRIHYDAAYAATEGHPRAVVHGPLNLVLMLDLWRDARAQGRAGEVSACSAGVVLPRRIKYRNTRPVYVGTWYRIGMSEEVGGVSELRLVDEKGETCMVGSIEAFREGVDEGLVDIQ